MQLGDDVLGTMEQLLASLLILPRGNNRVGKLGLLSSEFRCIDFADQAIVNRERSPSRHRRRR